MTNEIIELMTLMGSAAQPLIVIAIILLVRSWNKFDKSIDLLSQAVSELTKRLDKLEDRMNKP